VTGDPAAIAVATLNINGLPVPHPPLRPVAERAAALCARLVELRVDVLNLQEVFSYDTVRLLRDQLDGAFPHVAYGRGWRWPAGGLVTFSRLPLGPPSYRSFAGVVPWRGSPRFRLTHTMYSALHGVSTVRLANAPVTIVNTHLSANHDGDWSPGNRHYGVQRAQLRRLNRLLARDRPRDHRLRIVTGDFNVAADSDLYPLIVGHGTRRDPFAGTDPTTFHRVFLPPGRPAHRIDFVLVEGDERRYPVLRAHTFLDAPIKRDGTTTYLSDHVGLSATVGLAPSAADQE
jgi:endonuclease/exonuclease/phosphatase family metal-dependent hydrolase